MKMGHRYLMKLLLRRLEAPLFFKFYDHDHYILHSSHYFDAKEMAAKSNVSVSRS